MRQADLDILTANFRLLVEYVVNKLAGNGTGPLSAKTWEIKKSSLRLVLTKEG